MALPAVENVAEVRMIYSVLGTEEMVNVFHVDIGSGTPPWDQSALEAVCQVFVDSWLAELASFIHPSVTLQRVVATDLTAPDAAQFQIDALEDGTADGSSDMLPTQSSAVITWRTATRGKSFRGRSFMGGFMESANLDAIVAPALRTALIDFADAVTSGLAALDGNPLLVVVSYFTGGDKNADPPTESAPRVTPVVTPIVGWSVLTFWRTQRRRAFK